MEPKFILLTEKDSDGRPIIIGTSNISAIKPDTDSGTVIHFNFQRKDGYPRIAIVRENFDVVKEKLGL